jgi:hypothetical protein
MFRTVHILLYYVFIKLFRLGIFIVLSAGVLFLDNSLYASKNQDFPAGENFSAPDFPDGMKLYKPEKCWNGYTMVPYEGGLILIVDMKGNVVHHWDIGTERARLLENGHIVVMQGSRVVEYDWDGEKVWDFEVPGSPFPESDYPAPGIIHHDLQRLPNGNTIFIVHEEVPAEYKSTIQDPVKRSCQVIGDCFMEVNQQKEVVWQWHAHDGLYLNKDTRIPFEAGDKFDWTHSNTVNVIPENHWYEEGHEAFKPGNVIICSRHLDEIYIIDRKTKKVVWRYSGEYLGGISRPHEPFMIEKGLPGAGNIMLYDNGTDRLGTERDCKTAVEEITVVLEINPVSKQIVWLYQDENFYSAIQGTQQRLPNGNTFICESTEGVIFEVTDRGERVWEYVMPPFPGSDADHGFGTRPHRYGFDYCPQFKQMNKSSR